MSTDDSDKILHQLIQNCHDLKQQLADKSRLVESKKVNDNRRRILRSLKQRCLEKFRKEVDTLRKQDSALESCSSFLNSHISEIESSLIGTDEKTSPKFIPAFHDCDSRVDILLAEKYRYVAQLHKECQEAERLNGEMEAKLQKSKQNYLEKICSAALVVSDDFKSDIGDWIDAKFEQERNRLKIQFIDQLKDDLKADKNIANQNYAKLRYKMYDVDRITDSMRSKHAQIVTDLTTAKNGIISVSNQIDDIRCLESQSIANFPPNFDSVLKFVSQIRGLSFDDVKVEIDQYENIVQQLKQFSIDNGEKTLRNLENLLKELRNRYATAKCIKFFLKAD